MSLPPIFVRMIVHRTVEFFRLCLPGHDFACCRLSAANVLIFGPLP